MNNQLASRDTAVAGNLHGSARAAPARWSAAPTEPLDSRPNDIDFVALQAAYRASGGLARGQDLADCLQDRQVGDYTSLARLIVARRVFSFAWHDSFWVPMFLFDAADLSLRPDAQSVVAELVGVLDGWSLAVWFVRPNSSLSGSSPLASLRHDLPAVFQAARTDRFVLAG